MAKEVKDIQALINDRADKKLNEEISSINNFLSSKWRFIHDIQINVGTAEKPTVVSLDNIMENHTGIPDKLREIHKDSYRQKETEEFMEKVESIREDVDSLMSGNYNND